MAPYIYIGVTNNLKRRTTEHRLGKGGRFSSRYHLKQLVYYESFYEIRKALNLQKSIINFTYPLNLGGINYNINKN